MPDSNILKFIDDFRPFIEAEAQKAIRELEESETFIKSLQYFLSDMTASEVKQYISEINTIYDFQIKVMHRILRIIVDTTSNGLSFSGFDKLDKNKNYVFLSNHRDIFLDSGLLQVLLVEHGLDTSEITFGDNLMTNSDIVKVGKINKMFKVYRDVRPRELLKRTKQLSEYIRYTITEKKQSVWIAQRGGRTKDGCDKTQPAILKMLDNSGNKTFEENIKDLNIIPVSVSYEFEPCDMLKTKELYTISKGQKYVKHENEDLQSIINGVKNYKGKISINLGKEIDIELNELKKEDKKNNKIQMLSELTDKQIYSNYKLYETNYIAADLINKSNRYNKFYTQKQKDEFITYCNERINHIEGEHKILEKIFLNIYANPVFNKEM